MIDLPRPQQGGKLCQASKDHGGGEPAFAIEHDDAGGLLWRKSYDLTEIAVEGHEHPALVPARPVDVLIACATHRCSAIVLTSWPSDSSSDRPIEPKFSSSFSLIRRLRSAPERCA